jgi:hypothetical protein
MLTILTVTAAVIAPLWMGLLAGTFSADVDE